MLYSIFSFLYCISPESGIPSSHTTSHNLNVKILNTTYEYCLFLSCPKIPVSVLKHYLLIQAMVIHSWSYSTARFCAAAEMPCSPEFPTGDQLGWNKVIPITVTEYSPFASRPKAKYFGDPCILYIPYLGQSVLKTITKTFWWRVFVF